MGMAVEMINSVAFKAIVQFLIGDLINPITGLFLAGVDFTNLFVVTRGKGGFVTLNATR